MANFLGPVASMFTFVLSLIPSESPELKFMKEKFAEVNNKLDGVTKGLDKVQDLITLETQRAAYLTDAKKILYGFNRITAFIEEVRKAPCKGKTGPNSCLRVRHRIAIKYVKIFNVKENLFSIINGATSKTSVFGEPLLHLIKKTYKCNVGKINQFANGILKLAFKAEQVIITYEQLMGGKKNVLNSIDEWARMMAKLRDAAYKYTKSCYENIDSYMINDINADEKYQTGSSSNKDANKKLKDFLEKKYDWLDWIVFSFGDVSDKKHHTFNRDGDFSSLKSKKSGRKRNIIATFLDKGTYG